MIPIQLFFETEGTFMDTLTLTAKPNKGEWLEYNGKKHYILDVINSQHFVKLVIGSKPQKNGKV